MTKREILTHQIQFGKSHATANRWRTPVTFQLGCVWINASIFQDERGVCLMWPAQVYGGGMRKYRKMVGCTDLATRDQVERDILAAYRGWQESHPLPPKKPRARENVIIKNPHGQFVEGLMRGIPYDTLAPKLTDRCHLRVARVVNAIYGADLGYLEGLHERDFPLLIALAGSFHLALLAAQRERSNREGGA